MIHYVIKINHHQVKKPASVGGSEHSNMGDLLMCDSRINAEEYSTSH